MKKALSLLLALPLGVLLTSCAGTEVNVSKSDLTERGLTQAGAIELYPDDRPSTPDGGVYWKQQNCASCHGSGGTVPQGADHKVILSDKEWAHTRKPIDQYMLVAYGKGEDGKEVAGHPKTHDTLTKRQTWDLVWYCRSLAIPEMDTPGIMAIDSVFGSNCAVCHGKAGKGDGPLAHNLEPVPANFSLPQRFYDRTDAILYDHIANGIKWEGMPNFLDKEDKAKNVKFDKEYIWKLVQYVRRFQESNLPTLAQDTGTTGAPTAGAAKDNNKSQTR